MGGSEQRRARLHFGYTRICLDLRRLDLGGGRGEHRRGKPGDQAEAGVKSK